VIYVAEGLWGVAYELHLDGVGIIVIGGDLAFRRKRMHLLMSSMCAHAHALDECLAMMRRGTLSCVCTGLRL